MLSFEELYDPPFMEALQKFQLRALQVPRGGRYAEQVSKAMGQGLEFRDFKPYNAGDDLRAIDWNIYRRLGRVFVKLFQEQRNLPIYLMPDISQSMFVEKQPRIKAALKSALAFAAIGLSQHDNITLMAFSDDIHHPIKAKAGKAGLIGFARRLAELTAGSTTNLPVALKKFSGMAVRRGLLVVVSDFFDENGIDEVIKSLSSCRHELLLVQLVRDSDSIPDQLGDVRLIDCESSKAIEMSVTPEIIEQYKKAYSTFSDKLSNFAASRGCVLLRLNSDKDVLSQLSPLFQTSGRPGSMQV